MPENQNQNHFLKEAIPQGKLIDITVPISPSTPVYPGDPKPSLKKACTLEKDGFELMELSFGSHTGTHVDAPAHILEKGKTSDQLDLSDLMGKALLLDFSSGTGGISGKALETAFKNAGDFSEVSVLLLKTKNSIKSTEKANFETPPDSRWLEEDAAVWIVENGFKTVGVDGFSVDSVASESLPVHHILLSNSVNIVECLDLRAVEEGFYYFLCLPLKIKGCDGAPARVLLIADS